MKQQRRFDRWWLRAATVAVAALAALASTGCDNRMEFRGPRFNLPSAPLPGVPPPAGAMATEERAITGVDAVSLKAVGVVRITLGASEALTITAPERVMHLLTSEVRGGILELDRDSSSYQGQVSDIQYEVSVRRLDELMLDGAGDISATGLDTGRFVARLDGVGSIRTEGSADRQEVRMAGVADYHGARLESRVTQVHLSSGTAEVWARDRIEGWVGFGATLEYWGNPILDVEGQGAVRRLGDRP